MENTQLIIENKKFTKCNIQAPNSSAFPAIKEVYRILYTKLSQFMPEFGFVNKGDHYISTSGHKVDGSHGHSGKVYVYGNNPGMLIDYTRSNKTIWNYIDEREGFARNKQKIFFYLITLAGLNNLIAYENTINKNTRKLHLNSLATQPIPPVHNLKCEIQPDIWELIHKLALSKITIKNNQALTYLKDFRKYSINVINKMGIGYLPSLLELKNHLRAHKISNKQLTEVIQTIGCIGLTHKLTMPYYDHKGNIIGFVARNIKHDSQSSISKYMYNKGLARNSTLYNIHLADPKKPLIIVEGIFDSLHAIAEGMTNVIALGGSSISNKQINLIASLGFKEIILCLDSDTAGIRATAIIANKILDKVDEIILRKVELPRCIKDLDQLITEKGILITKQIIDNAKSINL